MFKNYTGSEEVRSNEKVKSSIEKKIRNDFIETYPKCEAVIDQIWPKKANVTLAKLKSKHMLLLVDGNVTLFQNNGEGLW